MNGTCMPHLGFQKIEGSRPQEEGVARNRLQRNMAAFETSVGSFMADESHKTNHVLQCRDVLRPDRTSAVRT
jgi:hypothetical protein